MTQRRGQRACAGADHALHTSPQHVRVLGSAAAHHECGDDEPWPVQPEEPAAEHERHRQRDQHPQRHAVDRGSAGRGGCALGGGLDGHPAQPLGNGKAGRDPRQRKDGDERCPPPGRRGRCGAGVAAGAIRIAISGRPATAPSRAMVPRNRRAQMLALTAITKSASPRFCRVAICVPTSVAPTDTSGRATSAKPRARALFPVCRRPRVMARTTARISRLSVSSKAYFSPSALPNAPSTATDDVAATGNPARSRSTKPGMATRVLSGV